MINIGEISKPSVEPKSASSSDKEARAKKVDTMSPIDATRKVKASTRREEKSKAKKELVEDKIDEAEEYDEKGKRVKPHHIDLKA